MSILWYKIEGSIQFQNTEVLLNYYFSVNSTTTTITGFYNYDNIGTNILAPTTIEDHTMYTATDNIFITSTRLFNPGRGVNFMDNNLQDKLLTSTAYFNFYNEYDRMVKFWVYSHNSDGTENSYDWPNLNYINVLSILRPSSNPLEEDLQVLTDNFNRQLEITMTSYPDSKINDDGVYEDNLEKLYKILTDIDTYQTTISENIAINDSFIADMLGSLSTAQLTTSENEETYNTVKQSLDDVKTKYDTHVMILSVKICIVLLIFMNGNEIYVRNASLFLGLTFFFTVIYGGSYLYK